MSALFKTVAENPASSFLNVTCLAERQHEGSGYVLQLMLDLCDPRSNFRDFRDSADAVGNLLAELLQPSN
jgi:hypothetical protein